MLVYLCSIHPLMSSQFPLLLLAVRCAHRSLIRKCPPPIFMQSFRDRAKEQVANLHYILSKTTIDKRPSVLWCYNKVTAFFNALRMKG